MHQVSEADQASSPVRLEAIFIKYSGGGESMGLSYAQEYSCRDHFRQRAFERFGVDDQHLNKWINQHLSSLSPYDSNVVQPANTEAYVASDGVIFVCNIKSREFITCFKAVNYQESKDEEEAYTNIHENNVASFKKMWTT